MLRGFLVLVVMLSTAVAHADGYYYTESVGGTHIKDQLGQRADSAVRIRLSLGMRQGSWAIEAWVAGDLANKPIPVSDRWEPGHGGQASLVQYGVDVKYLQPIADHLELYLRGGLSRAQTDTGATTSTTMAAAASASARASS